MSNNWNPFGAPGCGAPNTDIRIRNLEMDGLFPTDKNVFIISDFSKLFSENIHKVFFMRDFQ
jgi:hypothetical protein